MRGVMIDDETKEAVEATIGKLRTRARQMISDIDLDKYACGYVSGLEDAAMALSTLVDCK